MAMAKHWVKFLDLKKFWDSWDVPNSLFLETEVPMGFERHDSAFSCKKFSLESAQPSFLSSPFQCRQANTEPTAK